MNAAEQNHTPQEGENARILNVTDIDESNGATEESRAEGKSITETQTHSAVQNPQTQQGDESPPSMEKDVVQESSKDAMDEGGDDIVEGEEDAVIY